MPPIHLAGPRPAPREVEPEDLPAGGGGGAQIYRHLGHDRQKEVAGGLDGMVRASQEKVRKGQEKRAGSAQAVRGA